MESIEMDHNSWSKQLRIFEAPIECCVEFAKSKEDLEKFSNNKENKLNRD